MQKLGKRGIPTHYVKESTTVILSSKEGIHRSAEVIIRNVAAGHFSLRIGVPGQGVQDPILGEVQLKERRPA